MPKTTLLSVKNWQISRSAGGSAPRPPFFYLLQWETISAHTSSIRLLPSSTTYGRNRAFSRFLTLYLDQFRMPQKLKSWPPKVFWLYAPATSGNVVSQITLLAVHQNIQKSIMQ